MSLLIWGASSIFQCFKIVYPIYIKYQFERKPLYKIKASEVLIMPYIVQCDLRVSNKTDYMGCPRLWNAEAKILQREKSALTYSVLINQEDI